MFFLLLKCHTDLDLEGFEDIGQDGEPTGIKLPYIVTLKWDQRNTYLLEEIIKLKIR